MPWVRPKDADNVRLDKGFVFPLRLREDVFK
ncbi:hypothetical protein EGR_09437 [Echinococcus granulosus]|uniref:Uncharacterized protein n=1 Tax=Echinococcus granulosus TaxID=6210 RepID=W6UQM3_ECHGR|nr:hypothetical protein EGR_09437 [Echinococcus granulosus]EUB55724.1 hypothetical protein EGR_09437 [Echinococcus granulosus]